MRSVPREPASLARKGMTKSCKGIGKVAARGRDAGATKRGAPGLSFRHFYRSRGVPLFIGFVPPHVPHPLSDMFRKARDFGRAPIGDLPS